jgi:hypothetical protein
MEQTFIKTIQGHQLEFNKQTTAGYKVSPQNVELKEALSMQKDERGMWNVSKNDHLPAWFNEISTHIHLAIEENEMKNKDNVVFNQFGYLF